MATAEEKLQKKQEEKKAKQLLDKKQKEEAEAAKAKKEKEAEEVKKAEEKTAKDQAEADKKKKAEEAKKAKKSSTLKDIAEEYGLSKIDDGIFIPSYFTQKKRFVDVNEERVAEYHAKNFLLGLEIFAQQGSISAKITYTGPNRRYSLRNTLVAKRQPSPKNNNWKLFRAPIRLLKGTESLLKVKDPKMIRDLLTSQGGIKNFTIRFVYDKEFPKEEAKKQVFAKDPVRLRNLNYRIKKDQALLGIKPTLRDKNEGNLLLKDLAQAKNNVHVKHVIDYVTSEIDRFDTIEKKKEDEAKKD